MEVAIVGFKASGKTTVFNALTGNASETGGFSSAPGKANLGVIKVPDQRVDALAEVFKPRKVVFAEIKFADMVAQPEKPGKAQGVDALAVAQMRNVDALVLVARAFANPAVSEPAGGLDPLRDYQTYESELRITDFIQIESRLERLRKENKKGVEADVLERCRAHIEAERPLRTLALAEAELKLLSSFQFLSRKPLLVLVNTTEGESAGIEGMEEAARKSGAGAMALCAQVEYEIAQLAPQERSAFLREMGLERPAQERFIRSAYGMQHLISFFTVGEDEVRAWTIQEGTRAQQAAGKIHTDLERGFIRAAVVSYDDFMKAGSLAKARETGVLRQEGKDYTVKDGDIVEIKFNV